MSDKPDELDIQEAAVKAALRRRLAELKEHGARLADPRPWIQERPWASCGGAAGAGFALGWRLGAPKKTQPTPAAHDGKAHEEARRTVGAVLAASLLPAVQPMLKELIDNALAAVGRHGHHRGPHAAQDADVPAPESMGSGMTDDNQVV